MARRKNQPEAVRIKYHLAERLRQVRTELYGERGGPELARRLGVPIRTWYNYESGVTVPSEVVLRFIELTSVEPIWLLHGRGPKYRAAVAPPEMADTGGASIESMLRTVLHRLESRANQGPLSGSLPWVVTQSGDLDASRDDDELTDSPGGGNSRTSLAVRPKQAAQGMLAGRNEGRYLRVEGDAMAPIVADGAFVAFSETEDDPDKLDGKLVIAWVEGRPIVRWFERSGRFALLRAQNPAYEPAVTLLDLEAPEEERRVRRILWIGTPHH